LGAGKEGKRKEEMESGGKKWKRTGGKRKGGVGKGEKEDRKRERKGKAARMLERSVRKPRQSKEESQIVARNGDVKGKRSR